MELLSLPDDCLRLILKECPLQHLFSIQLVSHRFRNLIQHIFTTKRKLKIFGSYYEVHRYAQGIRENYVEHLPDFKITENSEDVIIVSNPNSETIYKIPQSFPCVSILVINCASFSNLDLSRFLEPWSSQLVSFSAFDLPKKMINLSHLWMTINSMSSLTRLHLLIPSNYRLPDNFTIVSQLEQFCLHNAQFDLVPILSHISKDIAILLSYVHFGPQQLEELIKRNKMVTKKIIGLDLGFFITTENRTENFSKLLQLSCDRLHGLQFLDLMFGEHLPLVQMMPSLGKLNKLTYLKIYIGRDQLPANLSAIYSLPQVPSVMNLHIEVFDLTFETFFQIISLFPKITNLQLKHDFEFDQIQEKVDFIARLKREFPKLEKINM